MPFSHHSHSGQFCGHATNTLEEVVQTAIERGMTTYCLTEHIPRRTIDFYPREGEVHTFESLAQLYDDFYHAGRALQKKYADRIQLLVGFEGEWIREYSVDIIGDLLKKYPVDLFVGSVHHIHHHPIDYTREVYVQARDAVGGGDEELFEAYFDSQFDMLQRLQPPVVGHFDLIRLFSDDSDRNLRTCGWSGVWQRVLRNLKLTVEYGGVLELNSSALRKGMHEAYPQVEICKEFAQMGGRFTLSDDSHGVEQVGLNYDKVRDCIGRAGIDGLCYLSSATDAAAASLGDSRFEHVGWRSISLAELDSCGFWKSQKS